MKTINLREGAHLTFPSTNNLGILSGLFHGEIVSRLTSTYHFLERFFFTNFSPHDTDNLFRGRVFLAISAIAIFIISYFIFVLSQSSEISFVPYLVGMLFCALTCTVGLRFFPNVKVMGIAFSYSISLIFVYTSFTESSLLNLNYFWYSALPLILVFLSGFRAGLSLLVLMCVSVFFTTANSSKLVAGSLSSYPMELAMERARLDIIGAIMLVFFVGVIFDLQRRRLAREVERSHNTEQRLKDLENQLVMRDTSNRIVRRLCHEINNPLNVILGYSEIMSTGKSNDLDMIASKIEKSSTQINGVVKKLADVAHTGDVGHYIRDKEHEINLQ